MNSKYDNYNIFSQAKQEELREKRFGSRVNKTFTFDFAGRSVKDEQQDLSFKKYAAEIENILNDKDNENYFSGTIAKVEENLFAPIVSLTLS